MSILRGHFAVMLIVKLPDAVEQADLEARLEAVRQRARPGGDRRESRRRPRRRGRPPLARDHASTAPTIPGSSTRSARRSPSAG